MTVKIEFADRRGVCVVRKCGSDTFRRVVILKADGALLSAYYDCGLHGAPKIKPAGRRDDERRNRG